MALVALAAAGLVGGGLIGVSQFASADRPEVVAGATGDTIEPPAPDTDEPDDVDDDEDQGPVVDGRIVIDIGDGDPVVIDLEGGTINGESFEQFGECVGLPFLENGPIFDGELVIEDLPLDFEAMLEDMPFGKFEHMGDLGDFGLIGPDGSHVTVLGPDGLSVIDLGDGDGSVTITQTDGELTIETEGSATLQQIDDLFGTMEFPALGEFDFEQIFEDFPFDRFEHMLPEDFEGFEFELPGDIQDCLDAIDNG